MPGKWQLLLDREDADLLSFLSFGRSIPRQNESRFRKIHLPRQGLHFAVIQSSSVSEDRERITGEWRLRENIELNKFVSAAPHTRLVHVYLNTSSRHWFLVDAIPQIAPEFFIWLLLRLTRTLDDQTTAS